MVNFVAGQAKDAGTKIVDGVSEVVGGVFSSLRQQGVSFKYDVETNVKQVFGIPMLITHVAAFAAVGVAAVGTAEVSLRMAQSFICKRRCDTCKGWEALQCTRCRGTGKVKFRGLKSGRNYWEKPAKDDLAVSIANGQEEVIHYPASLDTEFVFPSKEFPRKACPSCDGSGVMNCTECFGKDNLVLSSDKLRDVPRLSWDVLRKIDYSSEHILASMEDPSLAAYWLIAKPELEGGFKFDEDVKQKIWWKYKEDFLRYGMARKSVAEREPGWEHIQKVLLAIDPSTARADPVVVKNVPYYKATKKIKAEVMKLEVPQRPHNWGVSSISLEETGWTKDQLEDPRQKQVPKDALDRAWEMKWRKQKYEELVGERVQKGIAKFQQEAEERRKREERRNRKWWKWF